MTLSCFLAVMSVWYIPGWMRTETPQAGTLESISNTFPSATVTFKAWDGNRIWSRAVESADKESWRLAYEIAAMPVEKRRELVLVGHSLGARMTVRILARLAEGGFKIKSAYLLAAAIPYTDADLVRMGEAVEEPITAICNPEDLTLRYVYATIGGEPKAAYGANGSLVPCTNVCECVVPKDITRQIPIGDLWGKSEKLKEIANHHVMFYLEYMRRLVNGEKPPVRPIVPQDFISVETTVGDRMFWWHVLDEQDGWKLEKHRITGHCRILNPQKRRVAWGREAALRASFRKIIETKDEGCEDEQP